MAASAKSPVERFAGTCETSEIWWDSSPFVYESWSKKTIADAADERKEEYAAWHKRYYAGENPGEAAVLLHRAGKLFQVHINDNYRDWDHDLIVGSVTFWETLEFFYWLNRCGWGGWYILDIFPYRMDGSAALQEGVNRTSFFLDLAGKIDSDGFRKALGRSNVQAAGKELWSSVFGA